MYLIITQEIIEKQAGKEKLVNFALVPLCVCTYEHYDWNLLIIGGKDRFRQSKLDKDQFVRMKKVPNRIAESC